jgi:hypothetical protein
LACAWSFVVREKKEQELREKVEVVIATFLAIA